MGLDAVVYLGKTRGVHRAGEGRDSQCKSSELTKRTEAVHKRLGNATMIASLRHEISPFIRQDSIVMSKVLYSGSHSGDEIHAEDIDRLDSEIRTTRARIGKTLSLSVERFLDDMSDLVEAAREQESPIVFV